MGYVILGIIVFSIYFIIDIERKKKLQKEPIKQIEIIEMTKETTAETETKQEDVEKTNDIIKNDENEILENEVLVIEQGEKFPYILSKCIFTNKEYKFYLSLKRITDKNGLITFTKMRIPDLVYIPRNHVEFIKWFNYIRAKHVDFIVCDKELRPRLIIEVDDSAHDRESRIKRDEFVDKIFYNVGLKVLHIRLWQDDELERQVMEALSIVRI